MDRDQVRAQNKARQLIAKATKEKSNVQLELLLPVAQEWLKVVHTDVSHSKWFWADVEKNMEKDYAKERYIVEKTPENVPEKSSEGSSKSKSQADAKATGSKAQVDNVEVKSKKKTPRNIRKGV